MRPQAGLSSRSGWGPAAFLHLLTAAAPARIIPLQFQGSQVYSIYVVPLFGLFAKARTLVDLPRACGRTVERHKLHLCLTTPISVAEYPQAAPLSIA